VSEHQTPEIIVSYPKSYREARDAFRREASRLKAQSESHPVVSGPANKGDLTIDVALIGVQNPVWSLVVSSGLHGVEGFFGSAMQTAYMRSLRLDELNDAKGRVVLIHSINPFGFRMLRRANEDNIDLNRNFLLDGESYKGAAPVYAQLNTFLNPTSPSQRFDVYLIRALWNIARFNYPTFKQAIAEGQFDYPKGIFFGGHKVARSTVIIKDNILRWVKAPHVVHLDLHTGLGARAKYKLLVPTVRPQSDLMRYSTLLESEIELLADSKGIAFKIKGDFGRYMLSIAKDIDYHFFFAEFGTYSGIQVLKALRRENQAHFFTSEGSDMRERSQADLLECFCPASESWRTSVAMQGAKLIRAAQRMASLLS
jgi:hypothetical protein